MSADRPPILRAKDTGAPSVFRPENLLREARRQKNIPHGSVPAVVILDPDGDMVRRLRADGHARLDPVWACYHSELYAFEREGERYGIVGCAVGAPYAVLVAEQLFASGAAFVVSVTSAGQIAALRPPPYFVLIDRALRDEGTSYHYLPPSRWSEADPALIAAIEAGVAGFRVPVDRGPSWTTDAPFRETETAIAAASDAGALAVEMEAAALYAFARAAGRDVVCFAHVTNQMAVVEGDFEKGAADGSTDALDVVARATAAWRRLRSR